MYKKTLTAAGVVMAIVAGAMNTSATSAQEAVEFNTDRPGSDYKNFILQTQDYRICKQACGIDRRCQAWTYVKLGIQGGSAKCWLKGVIPRARVSNCCISGYKSGGGFSWHFASRKILKPSGGHSRIDWQDGTYEVWQNRGSRILRTKTKRHRQGLEILQWVVTVEGMPGKLTVGQAAKIRLKGSVIGYIKPPGKSAEVMRGNFFCVSGCRIVHKRDGKRMIGFDLNDRMRKFDYELEIRPPAQRPTKLPTFPITIELGTRGTKTLWTYLPG